MKKLLGLAGLFLLCSGNHGLAQGNTDSLHFMQMVKKADACYNRKEWDSAFLIYQEAYTTAKEKKALQDYYSISSCLLYMGHICFNRQRYTEAHQYYYASLQNARKFNHHYKVKNNAFRALNELHALIKEKDIVFPYPAITDFSAQKVFFSIDKVLSQQGDSAVIQINAGSYDGVVKENNKRAELFTTWDEKTGQENTYIGAVRVISMTGNKTIASVFLPKPTTIKTGWQVKLLVNTPDPVTGSGLVEIYRLNFYWKNSEKAHNIFNQRFAYYFAGKEMDYDIMDLLREELITVVKKLAPDTLNANSRLAEVFREGIFAGKNSMAALSTSNVATINYFLHYITENNRNYTGRSFIFSEIYATWALYGAPLSKSDLKKYVLGNQKKDDEMVYRASLVKKQAEQENLASAWVDEGLLLVDKSYWADLTSLSRLLYNYAKATSQEDYKGWSNFFNGVRVNDYGNKFRRDSFLTAAYGHFQTAGSNEGMQWIRSVQPALLDSTDIKLNIQRIHTGRYDMYPSPNQRYFATAGADFTIKIWDINLGKQIRSFNAHRDEISSLDYNPGGRYLASLSSDSTIKIWNTFTYELMNSFIPPVQQRTIKFSPDGKYLLSSGEDSTVNFWEPFTGKLVRSFRSPGGIVRSLTFHPKDRQTMFLLGMDSAVYQYRLDTLISTRILKNKEQAFLSFIMSNDGNYGCVTKTDSTFTIINFETNNYVYWDKIFTWKYSGSRYFSDGAFSPDSKYYVFCRSDSNTVFVDLQQRKVVGLWGLPVEQYVFNSNGNYFITHNLLNPTIVDFSEFDWQQTYDNAMNAGLEFGLWKDNYYSLKRKEFDIQSQSLVETRFSADDKSILYLSWETHKLDLTTGKGEMLFPDHHWMSGEHQYPEDDELVLYHKSKSKDTLFVYNSKKKNLQLPLSLPDGEKITSFCFYNKDKFCLLTGDKGSIACWDVPDKKMLYCKRLIHSGRSSFRSVVQQPGTNRMIIYGNKMKPLIINSSDGTVVDSINLNQPDRITLSSAKIFFTDSGRLWWADPVSYQLTEVSTLKAEKKYYTDVKVSSNGKYLYVLDASTCYVLETDRLQMVNRFAVPAINLINLAVSHNDSMIAVASMNGQFLLYKPLTGQLLANIYLTARKTVILMDSVGHYLASKEALRSVVFGKGYKSFNYDQFDLQLNQPHKVLSSIGVASPSVIQSYENAYKKRLERNGLADKTLAKDPAPSIIILNRGSIRPSTSREFYTIRAECFDNRNKLAALKIFVNDVPVIDSGGRWSSLDTTATTFDIRVPLTAGSNKVKIYCVNQLGLSSYKEMFDIYCTVKEQKQDTYFIGLGVSLYADKANNLTYSVKDIRDMAKSFKQLYPGIIIDTLIDKKVTLKNIELLKQRLKKIKVTDRVFMAVTGHGLLSDSLDFYYATHDVDFKNPAAKGLKYEELENILSHTAARQRLLLIDACHSGMVDKSTAVRVTSDTLSGTVKVKNARGVGVNATQRAADMNSFNLMQNQFADFSNDNGIVVISAAGGLEFAFESAKWKNGVFTYCVLKGLVEKEADSEAAGGNNDRKVSVQELMRYVSDKVPELTKGMQQPTSRRENLDFDWIIK